MFTVLNSESLWIGTDLKRFNEIRDILDSQNIKYKYKVKDQLGEWTGSGTIRGCVGYTVLLCFTLFKTGSLAKSIFGCH